MPRPKRCACGCGEKFIPKRKWQRYKSKRHKNRAAQQRLRDKARDHEECLAEKHGVMAHG